LKIITSIFNGDLALELKLGLSNLKINSQASKKGFLKSIAAPFPEEQIKGPLGVGGEQ